MTLTDFLLARIAEDEAAAGESLRATRREAVSLRPTDGQATTSALSYMEFIVRWPPARVLAECEAKRRVIEECDDYDNPSEVLILADQILRHLALPYADHPDYREEWRP